MQPYTKRPVTTRSLVGSYGVALLIPVVLWAISNPVSAAGMATLVGGAYTLGRFGIRGVHRRFRAWRALHAPRLDRRSRT